jgi:hypothetical protein
MTAGGYRPLSAYGYRVPDARDRECSTELGSWHPRSPARATDKNTWRWLSIWLGEIADRAGCSEHGGVRSSRGRPVMLVRLGGPTITQRCGRGSTSRTASNDRTAAFSGMRWLIEWRPDPHICECATTTATQPAPHGATTTTAPTGALQQHSADALFELASDGVGCVARAGDHPSDPWPHRSWG